MEIVNCEQRSDEWYALRCLRMTASNAQCIAACGKGLETYILNLCSEFLSSADKELFTNDHIKRGIELEEEAVSVYEFNNGVEVENVGFVIHNKHSGCSPDGFVGDNGLIEVKCKSDANHLKQILSGYDGIESTYMWQMQMQMLVCKRAWCDFVCYNPNFDNNLIVHRVFVDKVKQDKLIAGIKKGEEMININLKKLEVEIDG